MSHQVQINYEAIAIQCNSICEVAEKQLKELDRLLAEIESESKQLLNEQTRALKRQILSERESLLEEMKQLRERADRRTLSSTREATNLQKRVNELASQKIIAFEETLRTLLGDKLQDNQRKLLERSNGVVTIDKQTQELLDGIQDVALRQFVYIAYLKDNTLSGDALLKAGQALMGQTYESRMQEEQAKIRAEMEAARVDKATIDKVVTEGKTIAEIRENATTEIVGEKVRQKSLKIIMDAVQKRGFIVDKKNIKINREKNEVILVALKASGEKAEFKVYLDGRFIYDFRGYEGQACQKDIEPFMKDLEEVYGIHVTKTQEIWRNPDKISTMKYQTFNTNKNKQ
jgi:hypothetical protein